jgi:hypothetical protein
LLELLCIGVTYSSASWWTSSLCPLGNVSKSPVWAAVVALKRADTQGSLSMNTLPGATLPYPGIVGCCSLLCFLLFNSIVMWYTHFYWSLILDIYIYIYIYICQILYISFIYFLNIMYSFSFHNICRRLPLLFCAFCISYAYVKTKVQRRK